MRALSGRVLGLVGALALAAGVLTPAFAQTTYTTTYQWDANRRLTLKAPPDPDGTGPLARTAEKYVYDDDGRLTQTIQGTLAADGVTFTALQTTTTTYDAADQAIKQVSPAGVTQSSYDGMGRTICATVRMNPAVYASLPADACALGTTGTSGPDRVAKNGYDASGQLLTVQQAFGTVDQRTYATYSYSANGKQAKIVDARGNPTELEYDGFDRLVKLRLPPKDVAAASASTTDYEAYGYDQADNRTWVRRRDGQVIESCYDALNRNTRRYMRDVASCTTTGLADDVFIAYNLKGEVLSTRFQSASGSGVIATYDKAGRQLTEATFGKSLSFQYDKAGNRTRILWPVAPSFYVNYLYDNAGRPKEIRQNNLTTGQNLLAVYGYDSLGRRTAASYGNGTASSYDYDTAGRVTSLGQNLAGATHDQTFGFSYSPASQILSRTTSNCLYDWTKPAAGATSKTYTGLNQDAAIVALARVCSDTGAGYDCRGNLRRDNGRKYDYDVENRLTTVTDEATSATLMSLSYDPLGRLRQTVAGGTITQYLYEGSRLVATYDGGGTLLQRYVHGTGVDEPIAWYTGTAVTGATWLHHDWLGSVIAESDTVGAAAQLHKYGPWGEAEDWGAGSPFRYTGQVTLNDIELYYYKGRIYDPNTGRFLQTDPIGHEDDLNLYAYVKNDPVGAKDPSGTECHATNGYLVCDPPGADTAPFKVPLSAGSPTYIGPEKDGYHVYNAETSQSSATSERLEKAAAAAVTRDPVPNSGDSPATPNGTQNQALPILPSTVNSYVTQDTKGNAVVVNVTIKGGHFLHPGYVAQYIKRDGERVSIQVIGEGNAIIQANPAGTGAGSQAFQNKVEGDMREAILNEARKKDGF